MGHRKSAASELLRRMLEEEAQRLDEARQLYDSMMAGINENHRAETADCQAVVGMHAQYAYMKGLCGAYLHISPHDEVMRTIYIEVDRQLIGFTSILETISQHNWILASPKQPGETI